MQIRHHKLYCTPPDVLLRNLCAGIDRSSFNRGQSDNSAISTRKQCINLILESDGMLLSVVQYIN